MPSIVEIFLLGVALAAGLVVGFVLVVLLLQAVAAVVGGSLQALCDWRWNRKWRQRR